MATFFIDIVAFMIYISKMALASDALEQMEQQLIRNSERITEVRDEMDKLKSAYVKFIDLKRELEERRQQAEKLIAVIGPAHLSLIADSGAMTAQAVGYTITPEDIRKNLPLWQAVEVFLYIAGESRVPDIQEFLRLVDIENVSRQAIESAVNRHRETFTVRKTGRERYIGLKKP